MKLIIGLWVSAVVLFIPTILTSGLIGQAIAGLFGMALGLSIGISIITFLERKP